MASIIFLTIFLSVNNCAASATAKVLTTKAKAQEAETQKVPSEMEHQKKVAAIRTALPNVPKDLAGLIGQYAQPIDPVVEKALAQRKRLPEIVKALYTIIESYTPSPEQLTKAFKEGTTEELLRDLFRRVAVAFNDNFVWLLDPGNGIKAHYEQLKSKYKLLVREYQQQFMQGIIAPYGNTMSHQWKSSGFQPHITRLSRMAQMGCSVCKAQIHYPMPWMQPQYYHKRDCKTLEALAKKGALYQIVRYGEKIPQAPVEYLNYTTLHLDLYNMAHADAGKNWQSSWDLVISLPAYLSVAEYIFAREYQGLSPEEAYERIKNMIPNLYRPLRVVTTVDLSGSKVENDWLFGNVGPVT